MASKNASSGMGAAIEGDPATENPRRVDGTPGGKRVYDAKFGGASSLIYGNYGVDPGEAYADHNKPYSKHASKPDAPRPPAKYYKIQ